MATDVKYGANLDLNNLEVRNVKAQMLASAPTGIEGKFYHNTTTKQFEYYNGTAWIGAAAPRSGRSPPWRCSGSRQRCGVHRGSLRPFPCPAGARRRATRRSNCPPWPRRQRMPMAGYKLTGWARLPPTGTRCAGNRSTGVPAAGWRQHQRAADTARRPDRRGRTGHQGFGEPSQRRWRVDPRRRFHVHSGAQTRNGDATYADAAELYYDAVAQRWWWNPRCGWRTRWWSPTR